MSNADRKSRPRDFDSLVIENTHRSRRISTRSPGVKVLPGGYGRNRGWAKTTVKSPAAMTGDGILRWRITSDILIIETFEGSLDLSAMWEAGEYTPTLARVGVHGRVSQTHAVAAKEGSGRCVLELDALGRLRYAHGSRAGLVTFRGEVPLA